LFSCFCCTIQGQENAILLYDNYGVYIDYFYNECHQPAKGTHIEYIYLRFKNSNTTSVKVQFTKELWYDNKCLTCNSTSSEYFYQIMLAPGQTKQGVCGTKDKSLYIYSKMLDFKNSELSKFTLKNIKTERSE